MNILILSCGSRKKIVQYFRQALQGNGKVVAADMSPYAPALYDADKQYIVPPIKAADYIDTVLNICRGESITGVLSLIDPELSLLASNVQRFAEIGTTVIGSPYEQCERAFDKMQMFRWLTAHGYPCAVSYNDFNSFLEDESAGRISYPVFVKPVFGSASIAVSVAQDRRTADFLFHSNGNMMVQEFLNGQEIGADCYVDMISGKTVSIFTKKKIRMRAGETDKSVSFKDPALFEFIAGFAEQSGFRGQIDIDLFSVNGKYYISEVNPRYGGGYPHAYECGVDTMSMILNNLRGVVNPVNIGSYDSGVYMMKYSDIMIKREVL